MAKAKEEQAAATETTEELGLLDQIVQEGRFGCMVALDPPEVRAVPLAEAVATIKRVPLDGDVVRTARSLGISFGD